MSSSTLIRNRRRARSEYAFMDAILARSDAEAFAGTSWRPLLNLLGISTATGDEPGQHPTARRPLRGR